MVQVGEVWRLALSIALLCTFAACTAPTPSADLTHSVNLDGNDVYWLFWKYDSDTITFEVHVRTTGYIGLGFGENGAMAGADIVIGWVKDGRTYFKDRHAEGNSMPTEDVQQDYVLVSGEEKNGSTILRFYRKLDTCDEEDFIIPEGTVRVIFSWNDQDPVDEDNIPYHGAGQRGAKSVLLLGAASEEFNTAGYLIFDILQDHVALPPQDTYYHCKKFKQPDLTSKHHVLHIVPKIQETNLRHVHHIIIYKCTGEMEIDAGNGHYCYGSDIELCTDLWLGWTIGQGAFTMPETAGLPLGDADEPVYYELQIHYDNPQNLSTLVDSSGMRLYYTADLREHDVGILTLGEAIYYPPIVLPPGMEDFLMHSYCDSSCTNMIPERGIRAFGTVLHTHLTGVGVYTAHVRDGVHIGHLGQDVNYDSNYQAIRMFPEEKTILPGDQLQTTCVYDTRGRQNVTWGNIGTRDEMCLNFIYYYPVTELKSCVSMIQTLDQWYNLVIVRATTEGWSDRLTKQNVLYFLGNYTWSPEDRDKVRNFENAERYTQYCVKTGEPAFGGINGKSRLRPEIRGEYVEINPMCGAAPTPPGDGISGAEGLRCITMVTLLTWFMMTLFTYM